MAFWNTSNPLIPWGYFDTDAVLDIPFDWTEYLAGIPDTYKSHVITPEAPLECILSEAVLGVITARVRVIAGQTPIIGKMYGLKCHLKTTGDQEDDRTVYLKMVNR